MNIQFFVKNTELDEAVKSYIQEKIHSAVELIDSIEGVQVDVSKDRHHRKGDVYRVEVNVKVPKKTLRAEFTSGDIKSAMDLVEDKIEAQVRKYRDKQKRGWRRYLPF